MNKNYFYITALAVVLMLSSLSVYAEEPTGEVPPIVLTPHGSVEELGGNLRNIFKVNGPYGVKLHNDRTLKNVSLTLKNRTEASKVAKRNRTDYKNDEYYLEEARKFLLKYSNIIGVQNIESYLKYGQVSKIKHRGSSRVYIYIYMVINWKVLM